MKKSLLIAALRHTGLLMLGVVSVAVLSVAPAMAAVTHATAGRAALTAPASHHHQAIPFTAVGCSGDSCIYLSGPTQVGNKYEGTLRGCAWKTTVHNAYILLTGPNGWKSKSSTGTWYSTSHYCTGNDDRYGVTLNGNGPPNSYPAPGTYCAAVYVNGEQNGQACENMGKP